MKPLIVISAHCKPLPTSAANHMCDIAEYFSKQTDVFFITQTHWAFGRKTDFGQLYGIKNPFIKSPNNILRLISEIIVPLLLSVTFGMFLKYKLRDYDVISYSPTALQFPLMAVLKKKNIMQILILRDLFPEWLADDGLLKRSSLSYRVLKWLSHIQYQLSDIIGVQAQKDIKLLPTNAQSKALVINSFYKPLENAYRSTKGRFDEKSSATINIGCFGTFGRAQNWEKALEVLCVALNKNKNIKFHFYGSGNLNFNINSLPDTLLDQINIEEAIFGLEFRERLLQMDAGFFSLSPSMKNSNIPGKFLTYCKYGLPTFALCEEGSFIASLITNNNLGRVGNISDIDRSADQLLQFCDNLGNFDQEEIIKYFNENYSVESVAQQITILISGNGQ